MDVAAELTARLTGHRLIEIERAGTDWHFVFANDASLRVPCPWRIVAEHRVAVGDGDHEPKFGVVDDLVDVVERAQELLANKAVEGVAIRRDTGDLAVNFGDDTVLEILNTARSYDGWEYSDDAGLNVVAQGGGELALFED